MRALFLVSVLSFVLAACVGAPPVPCTECSGKCVDLQADSRNCGACGTVCGAGSVCRDGNCTLSCGASLTVCADTCVNVQSDPANCGGCSVTCQATETCSSGACTSICPSGQQICSQACVTLASNQANCGTCGNACTGAQACVMGTCTNVCSAGLTACQAGGATVCARVDADPMNCGGCGITCGSGVCAGGQCLAGNTVITPSDAGLPDGGDPGLVNLSVTNLGTRTCAQGGEMVRYQVTALTATTATVTPAPAAGCLSPGDEVLLMNLQGTAAANANVGNYELLKVSAIAAGTVTFNAAKTKFFGASAMMDDGLGAAATEQRVVLQRVPAYGTFSTTGGTLTADGWDGTGGGVFALRASERITLAGNVDMKARGYRGAPATTMAGTTGQQGESLGGRGTADDRNLLGAGGGGRGDGTNCGNAEGRGGGGAGHAFQGGRDTAACAGRGGAPVGTQFMTRIFLGSGGAAGGADTVLTDNPPGGAGGRGGGIVLLLAPTVEVTGRIDVSGEAGQGDVANGCTVATASTTVCWDFSGAGGGGSGGSFFTSALAFNGRAKVRFAGGAGGRGGGNGAPFGTSGGGGAIGRVWPMTVSCSDLEPSMGDENYLFAHDGDASKPYIAYCRGLGATAGGMYLNLANTAGSQNSTFYQGARWADVGCPGCSVGTTVTTRFQRVRYDPFTHRVFPSDLTFSTSTGRVQGQTSAGGGGSISTVDRLDFGLVSDCQTFGSMQSSANIDLRGMPFRLSAANVWTPGGFGGAGTATFSFDRQVVDLRGGGFCGDFVNRVFPFREHELEYFPAFASCQAVKTKYPAATDIAPFTIAVPGFPVLPLTCDLGFDGGGWALLSASLGQGAIFSTETVPVLSGVRGHIPASLTRLIAEGATRVHLRTAGQANTRSFTTVAGSTPIINLRLAQLLNVAPFSINDYQGPATSIAPSVLTTTCALAQRSFPNVYQACGNSSGLHWLDESRWQLNGANENLELYVR